MRGTGSGKSVAAQKIASRLRLPCHPVDDLTWEPGWTPVAAPEQRRRLGAIAEQDAWVLDSACSAWSEIVLARAELIVGLDYPRWFSLQRLLRRTIVRMVDKQLICNGNVETLRNVVGRDSIVRWHFRSFSRKRTRIRAWGPATPGSRVSPISRPAQPKGRRQPVTPFGQRPMRC